MATRRRFSAARQAALVGIQVYVHPFKEDNCAVAMTVEDYDRAFGHDLWGLAPSDGHGRTWFRNDSISFLSDDDGKVAGWPKDVLSLVKMPGKYPEKAQQTWTALVERLKDV